MPDVFTKTIRLDFETGNLGSLDAAKKNLMELQRLMINLQSNHGLPVQQYNKFNDIFEKINQNVAIADTKLSKGLGNPADIKAYDTAISKMSEGFRHLAEEMSNANLGKLFDSQDLTPLKEAQEQLAKFQQIASDSAPFDSLKEAVARLQTPIQTLNKEFKEKNGIVTYYETLKQAAANKDLGAFETALDNLAKKFRDVDVSAEQNGSRIKGTVTAIETLSESFRSVKDYITEANTNVEEQSAKVAELQQRYSDAAPDMQKIIQLVLQMGEASSKTGHEMAQNAKDANEMAKSIDNIGSKVSRFFQLANGVQLFRKAVKSAYDTIKDLDKVMTETAVVTDFTVGDMWEQLPEYTRRAKELGVSIHDVYEASTLYYQQGLSTNQVMSVTNQTLQMARIAGLGAAEATDRLTNALRGFNMEINENSAQRITDVYSELAAISASDVNEISVAMSKVASIAHSANMEFETTAAFLAQIIETTREAPETA